MRIIYCVPANYSICERLQVVAYEHGVLEIGECPGVKQRICAVNNLTNSTRDDGEPEPLRLFP